MARCELRMAVLGILLLAIPAETAEILDASELDGVIAQFIELAGSADRGVAATPFAGTADDIILGWLREENVVQEYAGLREEQLDRIARWKGIYTAKRSGIERRRRWTPLTGWMEQVRTPFSA